MTTFILNTNIPNANNDPSEDQPLMLANTQALDGWAAIDHVGFNAVEGGTHDQVTYSSENTPVGFPISPASIAFTAPGVADVTSTQHYWRNALTTVALSAIRAFGTVSLDVTGTIATLVASYNVTTAVFMAGPSRIVVTLVANAVTGNNPIILITPRNGQAITTSSFTAGVLTFTANGFSLGTFDFLILQI